MNFVRNNFDFIVFILGSMSIALVLLSIIKVAGWSDKLKSCRSVYNPVTKIVQLEGC